MHARWMSRARRAACRVRDRAATCRASAIATALVRAAQSARASRAGCAIAATAVEALLQARGDACDRLIERLRRGPRAARVWRSSRSTRCRSTRRSTASDSRHRLARERLRPRGDTGPGEPGWLARTFACARYGRSRSGTRPALHRAQATGQERDQLLETWRHDGPRGRLPCSARARRARAAAGSCGIPPRARLRRRRAAPGAAPAGIRDARCRNGASGSRPTDRGPRVARRGTGSCARSTAPRGRGSANGPPYAHSTSSTVMSPRARSAASASCCSCEELRRAARERFLDQLLLAAEVVIQQRDVSLRARRDRPVRQRLEAVIGDQRFDRVEQSPAGIVAATPFGAGWIIGLRERRTAWSRGMAAGS